MNKKLFWKQAMVRDASSQHHPGHWDLLSLLPAVSGSEVSPHSPRQAGIQKGEGAGSTLQSRRRPSFGTATPGLWPRQSFWWCTSGFTRARNSQPRRLSKHPSYRTLLLDPLGSSNRLRVLCVALSRAQCVLWGFPLYFHSSPSQRNATVHHFFPHKQGLNCTQGQGLPLLLPFPGQRGLLSASKGYDRWMFPTQIQLPLIPILFTPLRHKKKDDAEQ